MLIVIQFDAVQLILNVCLEMNKMM